MIYIYITTQSTFCKPALINYACILGDIHFHTPIEELSGTIWCFVRFPRTFVIIADRFRCQTTRFPNNGRPFCHPDYPTMHFKTLTQEINTIVRNPSILQRAKVMKCKGKALPLLIWTDPPLVLTFSHVLLHSLEELGFWYCILRSICVSDVSHQTYASF